MEKTHNVNSDLSQTLKNLKEKVESVNSDEIQIETKTQVLNDVIKLRNEVKARGLKNMVPAPSQLKKCGVDKLRIFRRELENILKDSEISQKVINQADSSVKRTYAKKRLERGIDKDIVAQEIEEGAQCLSSIEQAQDLASMNILLCEYLEALCEISRENLPDDHRMKNKIPHLEGWGDDLRKRKQYLDNCWSEIYEENQEMFNYVLTPSIRLCMVLGSSAGKVHLQNKIKKGLVHPSVGQLLQAQPSE